MKKQQSGFTLIGVCAAAVCQSGAGCACFRSQWAGRLRALRSGDCSLGPVGERRIRYHRGWPRGCNRCDHGRWLPDRWRRWYRQGTSVGWFWPWRWRYYRHFHHYFHSYGLHPEHWRLPSHLYAGSRQRPPSGCFHWRLL